MFKKSKKIITLMLAVTIIFTMFPVNIKAAQDNTIQTILMDKGDVRKYYMKRNYPNGTFKWKSSNKKIVTVNDEGEIKAVKVGKATVTCTVTENKSKTVLKWNVKVKNYSKDFKNADIKYLDVEKGTLNKKNANKIITDEITKVLKKSISKDYSFTVHDEVKLNKHDYSYTGAPEGTFTISFEFVHKDGYVYAESYYIHVYEKQDIITDYMKIPMLELSGNDWEDKCTFIKNTEEGKVIAVYIQMERTDENYNACVSYDAFLLWYKKYENKMIGEIGVFYESRISTFIKSTGNYQY